MLHFPHVSEVLYMQYHPGFHDFAKMVYALYHAE